MEGIRMIGMSICVTAAATSLFSMLIPDAKLERVLKFAISLFFLISLAAPFASWKGDGLGFSLEGLPDSSWRQAGLESAVQSQFAGLAERRLSALMEEALLREGSGRKKFRPPFISPETEAYLLSRYESGFRRATAPAPF